MSLKLEAVQVQKVQKVVEVPTVEDRAVHVPVQKQRHVPVLQVVPKTVEALRA